MKDLQNGRAEFVREQYIQYHSIRRQLNSFSWQIPSVVLVVLVLMLGADPAKTAAQWAARPLTPALTLSAVCAFTLVVFFHHLRNNAILRNFEEVLIQMEREFGVSLPVYAKQLDPLLPAWKRVRSSVLLMWFLGLAVAGTLGWAGYYWWLVFSTAI